MKREVAAATGITVLAGLLTLTRVPFRWNQIALAYASYFREYRRIIDLEGGQAAFTTFVGIHPPAYSLLFLSMMESAPITWFAVSGAFSVAAVAAVFLAGRHEGVLAAAAAALLLAVSPHRLAYALEPNNYPLLLLVTAASCAAFGGWVRGGRRGPLLLATVLGLWTHALFVTVPIAQALAVPRERRREAAIGLGIAALCCLPLLPAVLGAAGSSINDTPSVVQVLTALFVDLPSRYGPAWAAWLVVALAASGARGADPVARSWLLQLAIGGGVLTFALLRGTAATWQFPYYLLMLPPLVLLAGRALTRKGLLQGVAIAALLASLVGSGAWVQSEHARAQAAWDRARITHSRVDQAVDHWVPGASLIAIHFPDYSDDDKDTVDPAFAHLPMRLPIALVDPPVPTLVGADPYWGQPVRYPEDRWLYTFTAVDPERLTIIADAVRDAGQPLIVVAWSTHVAPGELTKLEQWAADRGRRPERGRSQALWLFPAVR